MSTLMVRNATREDVSPLVKIDNDEFSVGWKFEEGHFLSWLEVYPEGFFAAVSDDRVVGYASMEIISRELSERHLDWYQVTDNGKIRGTHDPSGDTVYGISFCVSRHTNGFKIGFKLMEFVVRHFVAMRNIRQGVIVSRMPGYHKVVGKMSAEEYVFGKRSSGRPLDPLLNFYSSCGFCLKGLIPNYMKDPPSMDYGAEMVYPNPNYQGGE